jgi:hypothetical protein
LKRVSLDISSILRDWPYRPDDLSVRFVDGEDGRRKIQLRLELGILQMEIDDRPDGRRIHDAESWLDYHRQRQRQHDAANPDAAPYRLEPEDCAELLREGVQYYHRYLSFWHLGCYELCARDTERNLRLFAFVREYARDQRDKLQFDQWRPYVTMMHARAVATPLIELEQWDAALNVVDAGIRAIERFLDDYDQRERAGELSELVFLQQWKEEILSKAPDRGGNATGSNIEAQPADRATQLRDQLHQAVANERYEEAARLRDHLRRLGEPPGDLGPLPPGRL